ncbi:hypothetical protein D9M69_274450 [compost metagenome]
MQVLAQRRVGGQQAVVGVQAGVAGVVVAGAEVRVAAQLAILATEDEHHLGVGLEADHAVDHHRAGLLQAAGELQVGFLVEARAQLDHRGDLLAVARRFHQRVDDFRVGPGAVQRLLDRQHVGVLGRLAQQVDHRGEGLERVQQQDVQLGQHAEQVFLLLQQLRNGRRERRVLQLGVAGQPGDAEQAGQVDRPADAVQLAVVEAELLEQVVGQVRRAGIHHFQAHRVAVAPREQLAAQCAGQVLDVLGVHREVGVAGQAELVAALHLHPGEQVVGVGVDHRGKEHIVVALAANVFRQADDPRQRTRRRDDRQAGVAAEGVHSFQLDHEVEALVHQQRERVGRVEADGGDDRRDLVAEEAPHPGLDLRRPVAAADEAHVVLGQLRQQDVVEDAVLAADLHVHLLADPRQRLVRQQAVGTGLFAGEGDLLLQPGDADLEELVEVAGEDQQELQAFQQRVGLIQRLFQHADVELQLREFAMNVEGAVIDVDRRRRHHFTGCRSRNLHGGGLGQFGCGGSSFEQFGGAKAFGIHRKSRQRGIISPFSVVLPRVWRSRSGCHRRRPV